MWNKFKSGGNDNIHDHLTNCQSESSDMMYLLRKSKISYDGKQKAANQALYRQWWWWLPHGSNWIDTSLGRHHPSSIYMRRIVQQTRWLSSSFCHHYPRVAIHRSLVSAALAITRTHARVCTRAFSFLIIHTSFVAINAAISSLVIVNVSASSISSGINHRSSITGHRIDIGSSSPHLVIMHHARHCNHLAIFFCTSCSPYQWCVCVSLYDDE